MDKNSDSGAAQCCRRAGCKDGDDRADHLALQLVDHPK